MHLDPDGARRAVETLATMTRDALMERYLRLEDSGPLRRSEEDFAYTWACFEGLPRFMAKAARDGRHVIFTVDP